MKQVVNTLIKHLLILFFLYYYIGTTAFVHTHYFDTYTVTHSHPFLPGAHHSHTATELETIGLLNMIAAETTPLVSVFFALSLIGIIRQASLNFSPHREFHFSFLRAPPANKM